MTSGKKQGVGRHFFVTFLTINNNSEVSNKMWSLAKTEQGSTNHEDDTYGAEENLEIQQLVIRILLIEGAYKNFLNDEFFFDDKLAYAIGLKPWVDGKKNYCKKTIIRELKKRLRAQQDPIECLSNPHLNEHIEQLSFTFGLTATEALMLRFMVLAKTNETLLSVFPYRTLFRVNSYHALWLPFCL